MGMYKCIKSFKLGCYDDNDNPIEGVTSLVEEGTLWGADTDGHKVSKYSIKLTRTFFEWIEISEETFKECFVEYKEEEENEN